MNTLRKTTGPVSLIQTVMILYLVVWSISPPLSIGTIYRIAAIGAVFVWFFLEFVKGVVFTIQDIEALMFIGAVALTSYIESDGFSNILKPIAIYMGALCFIIQGKYRDRWRELTNLIPIVLVLLIFFNFRTFSVLLTDQTIARKIVRSDEEMNSYLSSGVGGYALVYLQVCIFPAVLAWILKSVKVNRILFLIGVTWLVTYILLLMNAGYSLAIFTTAASTIILLFYKGRSVIPAVLVMVLIFFAAMLALIYFESLRNFLLTQFDGTAVAKKINDLVASSESGAAEGSIYSRMSAYKNSLKCILHYPLIGSFWFADGGGHSTFLDTFAKYGILGGWIYIRFFINDSSSFKIRYLNNHTLTKISNACYCSIVFVGILDSMSYEFMAPIILLTPVFINEVIVWDERLKHHEDSVDS